MKVALIGEYSSLHNNLAIALKDKGDEVLLVNDGDNSTKLIISKI